LDIIIKLCSTFASFKNPELSEKWFRENVEMPQINAFVSLIKEALIRSYAGVEHMEKTERGPRGRRKSPSWPTFHRNGSFISMGNKEYLLNEMSIGQIIMYYNLGMETKYPTPDSTESKLSNMSYEQLKALRDEMREQGLSTVKEVEEKREQEAAELKQKLIEKYGDIE